MPYVLTVPTHRRRDSSDVCAGNVAQTATATANRGPSVGLLCDWDTHCFSAVVVVRRRQTSGRHRLLVVRYGGDLTDTFIETGQIDV